MKIAQIAPPWLALPPKTYGGTESVLSTLVEEQVAQGHEVTLFAPGDAQTSACLVSFFPSSLIEEPFGMVMVEAIALGCPAISFAHGAAPEIIVHGRTGFLVESIPRIDRGPPACT